MRVDKYRNYVGNALGCHVTTTLSRVVLWL